MKPENQISETTSPEIVTIKGTVSEVVTVEGTVPEVTVPEVENLVKAIETLGLEAKASVSEPIVAKIETGSDIEKCSASFPFPDVSQRVKGLYYSK